MNVIAVMSDSFRRDHVGAFGNAWIKTPNLDRFAGQATVFPQWRFASYATIPIRTDLFTGRFSHAERPWQPLRPDGKEGNDQDDERLKGSNTEKIQVAAPRAAQSGYHTRRIRHRPNRFQNGTRASAARPAFPA